MEKSTYTTTRFDIGYCGYYVEVITSKRGDDEFVEFLICQEGYGFKRFTLGIPKKNCPETEWENIISDGLLRGGWVAMFCEDLDAMAQGYEMEDGCCGRCSRDLESLQEAIVAHNEHVEAMHEMAETLVDVYPGVETSEASESIRGAFNSLAQMAIWICCEANELEEGKWMVTDDYYVVCDDDDECEDDDGDC